MASRTNYKHYINDITALFLKNYKKRKLITLETHQEIGKGTDIYKKYGDVYSFEINQDNYDIVKNRFKDYIYMDRNNITDMNVNENYLYIFSKPIDCLIGMKYLIRKSIHFDIIDVDPDGSPNKYFPFIYDFLSNLSFLFITSGEMHRTYRFHLEDTLSQYDIKGNLNISALRRFFRIQNGSIISAELIKNAIKRRIGLFPIFFHDYYNIISGVHRIGFFIKYPINYKDKLFLQNILIKDPNLQVDVIKFTIKKENLLVPWRFNPNISKKEVNEGIISRLENFLSENVKFTLGK